MRVRQTARRFNQSILKEICPEYSYGFHGGSDGKASACNAEYLGSVPMLGRSPGEGNGSPFEFPCLENPMDKGAWKSTIRGVTKSWSQLTNFTSHFLSFSGRIDAETETPILWPPDVKN